MGEKVVKKEYEKPIEETLHLSDNEKDEIHELPKDIVEYLTNNEIEIEKLRE